MKKLHFTQEQITKILSEVAAKENGFEEVLKLSLEALMWAEREECKKEAGDKSNGYRPRKSIGRVKILEHQVPRTRHGNFYPLILNLLRNQEEEARQIAFNLYGAGLTTAQVGDLFGDIYEKIQHNPGKPDLWFCPWWGTAMVAPSFRALLSNPDDWCHVHLYPQSWLSE